MLRTSATNLKSNLGKYLKAIRAGREVVVTDRDEPIARIVPFREEARTARRIVSTPPDPTAPPLGQVIVEGIDYRGPSTSELLAEDRRRR